MVILFYICAARLFCRMRLSAYYNYKSSFLIKTFLGENNAGIAKLIVWESEKSIPLKFKYLIGSRVIVHNNILNSCLISKLFHLLTFRTIYFNIRAVASLTVPGGQEFHFPHFLSKFWLFFRIFPRTFLIFPYFGSPGGRVGKALATPLFNIIISLPFHKMLIVLRYPQNRLN